MSKEKVVLPPVTLNGEKYVVSGDMAITTSGEAIKISDSAKSNSRFK